MALQFYILCHANKFHKKFKMQLHCRKINVVRCVSVWIIELDHITINLAGLRGDHRRSLLSFINCICGNGIVVD